MSRWLRWSVGILILGGLAWQAARLGGLGAALRDADPALVAASLVPGALAFVAFALAWIALTGERAQWRRAGRVWFASLLARYAPGAVWQPAVRASEAQLRDRSGARAISQYASEQALACASASALVLLLDLVVDALPRSLTVALLGLLGVAAAAPALLGRYAPSLRWNAGAVAGTVSGHVLMAGGFALLAAAWPSSAGEPLRFALAFLVAGLAGLLAVIVPAGLGVREAVLAWLLAPALGSAEALAVALAARAWSIACELLAWAGWWSVAKRRAP